MLPLPALLLAIGILGCARTAEKKQVPNAFADAQSVLTYLKQQNEAYVQTVKNVGDLSKSKRADTAEHIFNAVIGELFAIRTAGNIIGDHTLGSVES